MTRLLTVITLGFALLAIPCGADPSTVEAGVTDPQPAQCQEALSFTPRDLDSPVEAVSGPGDDDPCTGWATCEYGPSPVTCTGEYMCPSVDQNCQFGIRGRATCDGQSYWCDPCPVCPHKGEPCETDNDCQVPSAPGCEFCTCEGKFLKTCSCPS